MNEKMKCHKDPEARKRGMGRPLPCHLSCVTHHVWQNLLLALLLLSAAITAPSSAYGLASNNVPLDSPVYFYIEKLSGFGLLESDVKGLKPYSKAEAARLLLEAEGNLERLDGEEREAARAFMARLRELVPREASLRKGGKPPLFDANPLSSARLRYVYLDGIPRDYNRDVRDPGHQSVFGFIGGDLRPLAPNIVHTTGTEGTPLLENNEGVIYRRGHNAELRWATEGFVSDKVSLLVEPLFLSAPDGEGRSERFFLQKGYVKLGGGGAELEVGRDANWFGLGYRGAITLTNNARNFDQVKLSSPEPVTSRYLWDLKYAFVFSRLDPTIVNGQERHPYFMAAKLSFKPARNLELGFNLGREAGGPGVDNSTGAIIEGLVGGTEHDNSNSLAGIELRWRLPFLRNTEIFGEFSGEDTAPSPFWFWPFVESYVAGIFIPRLTSDGKDDLRFEYFWGSVMLYGDYHFPAGYVYHNMTPGHSQGTAAQDFFVRYSHWFSPRNNLALEYFHTDRGKYGKLPGQVAERKDAWRGFWKLPLYGDMGMELMYGWERVNNLNLVGGVKRTNQLVKVDVSYRY